MPYLTWNLTPEEIAALPVDDLALRVLKDARDTGEWNWHNWMIKAGHDYGQTSPAMLPLSEAWAWLINRGLVVWNPAQSTEAAILISRRGHEVLGRGLQWLRAVERLDAELTPELERKARPQFLRGDFETATFVAMKEVEVRVRELARLPTTLVGTKLMQEAFRPPKDPASPSTAGPLWQTASDPGEAVALMELFKGAIGLFKNPASHRPVDLDDATEAAETILLADLLMRLLAKLQV